MYGLHSSLRSLLADKQWHNVNTILAAISDMVPPERAVEAFDAQHATGSYTLVERIEGGRRIRIITALSAVGAEGRGPRGEREYCLAEAPRTASYICVICGVSFRAYNRHNTTIKTCSPEHLSQLHKQQTAERWRNQGEKNDTSRQGVVAG